jgi:uncharacterized membrane protein YfcA
MSSTSSGCYHLDHITTQIGYVFPAILGAAIAFILSGLLSNYTHPILLGLILAVALTCTLTLLSWKNQQKDYSQKL